MRMRKKRNFEARMEACGELLLAKGANGILNMKEAAESYRALIDYEQVFGADRAKLPVALEIGCGKGGFVITLAKQTPDVNYFLIRHLFYGQDICPSGHRRRFSELLQENHCA